MRIELKNVKHAAFSSHESECFEATIYIDGKRRGTVRNDGYGGCNVIEPWSLHDEIETYAKTLPPHQSDSIPEPLPMTADFLISLMLDEILEERDLRRKCSRMVLFRKPGDTYRRGEYHTLKGKYSPQAKAFLLKKYGDKVEIVNERFTGGR